MSQRIYYSVRTGKNQGNVEVEIKLLRKILLATYNDFINKDYFQEAFGKECVDGNDSVGIVGSLIATYISRS